MADATTSVSSPLLDEGIDPTAATEWAEHPYQRKQAVVIEVVFKLARLSATTGADRRARSGGGGAPAAAGGGRAGPLRAR